MSSQRSTKSSKRSKGNSTPDQNYIPRFIADGFLKEFRVLSTELADSHGFKGRYLVSELFSKFMDETEVSAADREAAAIKKWLSVERENCKTNVRLFYDELDCPWVRPYKDLNPYETLVNSIRMNITKVLGTAVPYPEIFRGGVHSNGASTRIKREPGSAVRKLQGKAHISSSAIKHWLQFANSTRLSLQDLEIEDSSAMFTVPKKTEIDRVACKEPEINMLLQRSVGKFIAKRLRRQGINLKDQRINQSLAKLGSIDGKLATVDLSSASDSVTQQLVTLLLPFDWWSLLDDLRVHSVRIGDQVHEPEMFSSMGNGFTFELESLLFWAMTKAIKDHSNVSGTISVFGDDIICPTKIVPRLKNVFGWFGFKVNTKKSHYTGRFRESCGKHYHSGIDVSPFYVKRKVAGKSDLIRVLNRLMEWDSRGVGFITDPSIMLFHTKWSSVIPEEIWGGQDPDRIDALVTGHPPRKRLVWNTKKVKVDEEQRLTTWFLTVDAMSDRRGLLSKDLLRRYFWYLHLADPSAPISVTASSTGKARLAPQCKWTDRSMWRPWQLKAMVLNS